MAAHPSITGIGLVTPLGRSAPSTFEALLAGRFISNHARLESNNQSDLPRVVSLAIEAADEAIAQAGWTTRRETIALIACTSKGSIESWLNPIVTRASSPCGSIRNARNFDISMTHAQAGGPCHDEAFGLSDLSTHLARHIGSTDAPRLCLSSACASGLHGLIRGTMMIQSGEADRVLIVAAEASVHPLFLASFARLGVLAPAGGSGGVCRPFDQNRNGFLMSEAAAAICLEANSNRPIATIDRYALGGDATHLTGSDPHGTVLRHLLRNVIGDSPMDLIHAHGTGTVSNDSTELAALQAVIGKNNNHRDLPSLYSHKAALGHSLGASGLVAVAINCLCHQTGQIPGNIHTANPLPTTNLKIEQCTSTCSIHRSLIHAAGFGGPTAVVSLISPHQTG